MDKKFLKIYQLTNGYCYNSDSLFLADFARSFLKKNIEILDVGAGSGIVGLLCVKNMASSMLTMIDTDRYSIFLSRLNAQCLGVKVEAFCGNFLNFKTFKKFDVILSNPPFYRRETIKSSNEKISRAKNEEFLPFDQLCKHLKRFLKPRGSFVFCYDAKESHRVFYTLKNMGFNAEIARFVHSRIGKDASLMLCKASVNTRSSLRILPPLFTHNSTLQMDNTDEVKSIYRWAKTYSIKVFSDDIDIEYALNDSSTQVIQE